MAGAMGTIGDLQDVIRRAGDDWPLAAEYIATRVVLIGQDEAAAGVEGADLIFRAKLLNSFKTKVSTEGTDASRMIVGQVYSDAGAEAIVADVGRKPGAAFPSVQALRAWVTAKIGSFNLFLTKRGAARKVRAGGKNSEARAATGLSAAREVLRLAFLVARNIQRDGTKGIHFIARASAAMQAALPRISGEEVDRYLGNLR